MEIMNRRRLRFSRIHLIGRGFPVFWTAACLALVSCNITATSDTATPPPTASGISLTETEPPQSLTPTSDPTKWIALLSDNFDSRSGLWSMESEDGDYMKTMYTLAHGKFIWTTTAKTNAIAYSIAAMPDLADFQAAVEIRQTGGAADADYGVLFRFSDSGSYYAGIREGSQEFGVFSMQDWKWYSLVDWIHTVVVNQGAANQLAVRASGTTIRLYLNGHFLALLRDESVTSGKVGLAVELNTAGDTGSFEFDNFEVRAP